MQETGHSLRPHTQLEAECEASGSSEATLLVRDELLLWGLELITTQVEGVKVFWVHVWE